MRWANEAPSLTGAGLPGVGRNRFSSGELALQHCHLTLRVAIAAILTGLGIPQVGHAQGPSGQSQASFTAAQAALGAELYESSCAECHLPGLEGSSEAPELAGPNFRGQWGGRPVTELLNYTRLAMPPAAPGSLTNGEYAAVVAYLIEQNGAAPSSETLTLASAGVAVAGSAGVAARAPAAGEVLPAPGRLGTAPSPEGVGRPPEVVGDLYETPTSRTETFSAIERFQPVSETELLNPPAGEWLHWRGNPASWGYSRLSQLDTTTVRDLQLAWAWQMEVDELRGWQGPLIRDGVLFLSNPRNVIQALDAASGRLLWEYQRQFPGSDSGINLRTLAIWEDLVFVATRDAYLVALEARTGRVRWEARLADSSQGYTNSTGPIVADGKVINGINGCQRYFEETCFITGHDARTGEELWRTYTIARPGEPGGDTWGGLPRALRGGGDVWNGGSWDPELGLVYFGVAQAKPWVAASRGTAVADSALYTNSTLALDVDDGRIVWYRQHVPGESLDLDEGMDQVLVDIEGTPSLLTMGKHGILWKLDRRDGRFLGLRDSGIQNVFAEVDPETGSVRYREDIQRARAGDWVSACPSTSGGHNWHSSSYHPGTALLVIPMGQNCMEIRGREPSLVEGAGGAAADRVYMGMPGAEDRFGRLSAFRVDTMEEVWRVEQRAPFLTAALTTAGGLVFAGGFDRWIRAYSVTSGEVLWETRLGGPVGGYPVTYEVDGVQYLAVATATGGGTAHRIGIFLTPELRVRENNVLYVFRLPADGAP